MSIFGEICSGPKKEQKANHQRECSFALQTAPFALQATLFSLVR